MPALGVSRPAATLPRVRDESLDIAVGSALGPALRSSLAGDLVCTPLRPCKLAIVVRRGQPRAARRSLADLMDSECITAGLGTASHFSKAKGTTVWGRLRQSALDIARTLRAPGIQRGGVGVDEGEVVAPRLALSHPCVQRLLRWPEHELDLVRKPGL